jgi:hypothetical protein
LAIIPEERPAAVSQDMLFSPNTVYFGKGRKNYIDCPSRGQAELVARLANLEISGEVKLPFSLSASLKLLERLERRISRVRERFQSLVESRTGDERIREQLIDVLERWFVLGRAPSDSAQSADTENDVTE